MRFLFSLYMVRKAKKPSSGRKVARDSVTEGARVTFNLFFFFVTHSPSVAYGASSLPEGASFMFMYALSILLTDKHCICVHKRKMRHISFKIHRIFENCPSE